jgi:hypothetical protein
VLARLLSGILGIVAVSLGVPFLAIGLAADDEFVVPGVVALAIGLVLLAVWALLLRKEFARRARLRNGRRLAAEVVDAKLQRHIRVGVMMTVDLTVRIDGVPGGAQTRRVQLPPSAGVKPGDRIDVFVDPDDPSNFEPAVTVEGRLR